MDEKPELNDISNTVSDNSGTTTQPPDTAPAPEQVQAADFKKSKKSKLWLLLIVIVLLVGGSYLLYTTQNKPKVTTTNTVAAKRDIPLIRFGTADGPVNVFYPSKDAIMVGGQQLVNNQVYEGLVAWKDSTSVTPLLATSWTNPDESTWIFSLRKNVKFHTGNIMTATDVKYTLDNFKESFDNLFGATIKEVTVVTPSQVKITTEGPDPLLLNRLTNLFIVDSKGTKPDNPINGTGPYVLKPGTDPTKDKVTDLVAFDGYWGGHVYTRELQVSEILNEDDQVKALKNNKIDIFDNFVHLDSIKDLRASGIKMVPYHGLIVTQVAFNAQKAGSPLGNLKFRQALNIGISREELIKAAGVDGKPIGQYMVSSVPGYLPKLSVPVQDVSKAKALIVESGVKNPTLTVSYGTDSSNQSLMTEFQKESAALGITVKLDPIDDLNDLITKYLDGKTDMIFFANSTNLLDASDILTVFQSPGVYDNPDVDKLLTEANQTIDGAKHLALLQRAAQLLDTDAAGIPFYTRTAYYAQTSKAYDINSELSRSQCKRLFLESLSKIGHEAFWAAR